MDEKKQSTYDYLKEFLTYLKNHEKGKPFIKKPDKKKFPEYYEEIRHPMALNNIYYHLVMKKDFSKVGSVKKALDLVWNNCYEFNRDGSQIVEQAKYLENKAEKFFKKLDYREQIHYPERSPRKQSRHSSMDSMDDDLRSILSRASNRSRSQEPKKGSRKKNKELHDLTKQNLDYLDIPGRYKRGLRSNKSRYSQNSRASSQKSYMSRASSRSPSPRRGGRSGSPGKGSRTKGKSMNMTNKRTEGKTQRERYDYSSEVFFSVAHQFFTEKLCELDQNHRRRILDYMIEKDYLQFKEGTLPCTFQLLAQIDKKFNLMLFRGYPVM